MKKLFAIAFTCVYLTLTVGVAHTTHYCMGRVKSSSLFSFDSEKCFCSLFAFPASKSCCDDESTLIKIEDDQTVAWTISVTPEFYSICELTLPVIVSGADSFRPITVEDKGPPGNPTPLFVKHCSLILYSEESIA
jgi:hypothetical protein